MRQSQWQMAIANTLGTLGYLSCGVQWVWTIIIMAYPIITDENSFLFQRDIPHVVVPAVSPTPLSPVVVTILIIATFALLVFTIITLLRLPKAIGKTGAKLTRATSTALLPALTHHKKLSKQRRITLSYQTTLLIKSLFTLLPLIVLVFAPIVPAMPREAMWTIALFCLTWTALAFGLQALVVKLFNLNKADTW